MIIICAMLPAHLHKEVEGGGYLLHAVVVDEISAVVGEREVSCGGRATKPHQRLVVDHGRLLLRVGQSQVDVFSTWNSDTRLPPPWCTTEFRTNSAPM